MPRGYRSRWSRRRFVGTALGTALAAGAALWPVPSTAARAAPASFGVAAHDRSTSPGLTLRAAAEPAGSIVLPRGREIGLVAPDGSQDRAIVTLDPGEFIADVALAPDGSRVAFGLFTARTGDGAGGSDIVIAPVSTGAERTIVVPRDRPGMLLAAPMWAPDGQSLVFEAVGLSATGQAAVTAEWVAVDGTGRRTVAQQARYPSFSPDGNTIVYTRALPTGDALWEVPLGGGEGREIIPEARFVLIVYPRYSGDGSTIAFGAAGDEPPVGPGLPGLPGLPTDPGTAPLPPLAPPAPPASSGSPPAPESPSPTGTGSPPGPTVPSDPVVPGAPATPKLLPPGWSADLGFARAVRGSAVLGSGRAVRGRADPGPTRTVAAHGFPISPYVVSPSGGDARQIAELPIDDGAVAWSPDGAWLAISGAPGLFLVAVSDGEIRRVTEHGSFGAIDWR